MSEQLPGLARDVHFRARSAAWWGGVEVCAFFRDRDRGQTLAARATWAPIAESCECPVLQSLTMEQSQVLMDDLWNAGVRPTEGAGSAGAVRAAERHIEDLRTVTFKLLGVSNG